METTICSSRSLGGQGRVQAVRASCFRFELVEDWPYWAESDTDDAILSGDENSATKNACSTIGTFLSECWRCESTRMPSYICLRSSQILPLTWFHLVRFISGYTEPGNHATYCFLNPVDFVITERFTWSIILSFKFAILGQPIPTRSRLHANILGAMQYVNQRRIQSGLGSVVTSGLAAEELRREDSGDVTPSNIGNGATISETGFSILSDTGIITTTCPILSNPFGVTSPVMDEDQFGTDMPMGHRKRSSLHTVWSNSLTSPGPLVQYHTNPQTQVMRCVHPFCQHYCHTFFRRLVATRCF